MVTSLGRSVDDFTFGKQLGKGGFATVYSARSKRTAEEVAIKIIDKNSMKSAGVLDRVKNEVAIHSKLKHTSIVELLTYFESEKYVYLVLELCYNGELFTYLKKHQMVLNERETACVLFQICTGLLHLHSQSILHRDLSLSNILLTRSFQIKIGDFGLATHISDNLERRTTICGTLDFMAPEIFSSDSQGFYSDIWSLGCIMYILLTGYSPMENSGLKSAFRKMAACRFVIPSKLSFEAQELLQLLLKKSPTERIELSNVIEHRFIVNNIRNSQKTDTFRMPQESHGISFPDSTPKHLISRSHDNIQVMHYSLPRIPPKQPPTPPTRLPPSPQANTRPASSNSLPSLPQRDTSGLPLSFRTHRSDSHTGFAARRLFPSKSSELFRAPSSAQNSLHAQSEASLHISALPSICDSERLALTPINTSRLKPISLSLTNVELELTHKLATILFLYKKSSREVTEIFLISPDGFNITLFKRIPVNLSPVSLPTNEHELYVSSTHPGFKIVARHTYQELPDRLRKKYLFALEFVNILRTKTPKLTLHTEICKCCIMENSPNPDIEVVFQCGIKVKYTSHSTSIHTEHDNYSLENNMQTLPQHLLQYVEQAKLYKSYCTKLETLLEGVEAQMNVPPLFPVSFGAAHSKIKEKEIS